MAAPLFNISGIASGLDTSGIIQSLMEIERAPIRRLERRQDDLAVVDAAWSQITTKLSGVRDAIDALRDASDWAQLQTATSSNEDLVGVSISGTPAHGALSFTVDNLATTHQVATAGTFSSPDELVGSGTLTLKNADGTETLATITTDATTTLADLADQINQADVGVAAQVLETSPGVHQVVLGATGTGAAAAFTLTTDIASLGAVNVLQQGADAQLSIGSLAITRPSNQIDDLIEGVTLDLKDAGGPVTIDVQQDDDGAVEAVTAAVDAVNSALATLDELTAYEPDTGASGPLQGEALARSLTLELRRALTGLVPREGELTHSSQVGIQSTSDGRIELDADKLRETLESNWDEVVALFTRSGTATVSGTTTPSDYVSFLDGGDGTVNGTYAVVITQAATRATADGTYAVPGADTTFTITQDATAVDVTVTASATAQEAVTAINDALAAAGVGTLQATTDGTNISIADTRYGAGHTFTLSGGSSDIGLTDATYTGQDVDGTIGGEAASGLGQSLIADAGDPEGLQVRADISASELTTEGGTLTVDVQYSMGLGGALHQLLERHEGSDGAIENAQERIDADVAYFDERIAEYERRIESRERTLRARFTAMEVALAQYQSQGAWLSQQLAGLSG